MSWAHGAAPSVGHAWEHSESQDKDGSGRLSFDEINGKFEQAEQRLSER